MELKEENIKTLKQNDRIEFYLKRIRLEQIKPIYKITDFLILSFSFQSILLFLSAFLFFAYDKLEGFEISIFYSLIDYFTLALTLLVTLFLIYTFHYFFVLMRKHNKRLKELEEEYFSIKTK